MNLKRIRTALLLTAVAAPVLGLLIASPPAHAAIGSDTPIPAAPSNLTAKAVGTTSVQLTWKNNAGNQSGVVISRDGVESVDIQGAKVSSYTWNGLSPGTKYWFYIASKIYGTPGDPTGYGNTQSAWVGQVFVTTPSKSAHKCLGAAAFPLNDLCVIANYTVLDAHRLQISSVGICVDIQGPAVAAVAKPEVNIYSSGPKIWSSIGKALIYGPIAFASQKCEWFWPGIIATSGKVGVWGGSAEGVFKPTEDIIPLEWVGVSNFR